MRVNIVPALAQWLSDARLISPADADRARTLSAMTGEPLGQALVRSGAIVESDLLRAIAARTGLPFLTAAAAPSLEAVRSAIAAFKGAEAWFAERLIIAWRNDAAAGGALCFAGPRLYEAAIQEEAEKRAQEPALYHLISSMDVNAILSRLNLSAAGDAGGGADLRDLAESTPIIDLVNSVLADAHARRASDVHFEPFEDHVSVRVRVDGVLSETRRAPRDTLNAIASRIKILSGMDIAERRLPQDGRQQIRLLGADIDVRVSTLPTAWGESIVVRLLGNVDVIPELDGLGLTADQTAALQGALNRPDGMILVTGPTGSGKTTTVYRLLRELNNGVRKIITIEDPVEFNLPGVLQMAARPDIELGFAQGLRSILRQDPDVIFIGEIRDAETARTAVQAAMTGHLVISTLHTNSAFGAILRLWDLGVEPFLLADTLRCLVGQRLLRRTCAQCCGDPERMRTCAACGQSGRQGRIGVFEVAAITRDLQDAIRRRESEAGLTAIAAHAGFIDLRARAAEIVSAGVSAPEEAARVFGAASP
ncbi:MAG: AAA family ATPase [Alphaproteobacteria bacterium]|nr:AAA family ATPase [Alphaproteobacteria bacterium]